jgi:hypothetical protein
MMRRMRSLEFIQCESFIESLLQFFVSLSARSPCSRFVTCNPQQPPYRLRRYFNYWLWLRNRARPAF